MCKTLNSVVILSLLACFIDGKSVKLPTLGGNLLIDLKTSNANGNANNIKVSTSGISKQQPKPELPKPIDSAQCLLYLPLDDDVKDQSAYNQTVSQQGSATIDRTVLARGYGSLNLANGGHLQVPSIASLEIGLDATFCLYFRNATDVDEGELLSNVDDATGKFSVKILAKPDNYFQVILQTKDRATYESPILETFDDWIGDASDPTKPTGFTLVCVVYDGTYVKIWRNRELIESKLFYGRLAVSNAPFRIGKGFQGHVDDVLICGRAFSDYDIGTVWSGRRSMELRGFLPLSPGATKDKLYLDIQPQPSPNGCGHTELWKPVGTIGTRIVGGFAAEANELPFQVFTLMRFGSDWYQCGGSIIDNHWIVTAAHCVTSQALSIADEVELYFGLLLYSQLGSPDAIITNQSHIAVHPDWRSDDTIFQGWTDFALLYLENPIVYGPSIQPICLPESCDDTSLCRANDTVLISGYGITTDQTDQIPNGLMKAYTQLLSDEECRQMAESSNIRHIDNEEHRVLCAYARPSNDIATCKGDSGGPLACFRAGYFTLQGVTSAGLSCAEPGVPKYSGDICEVRDWITEVTGL